MIVWVKYGFESTPLKMYNTNVSSAILLSFLKATCIKDIDDYCKQKNIQLSIELDAIRRAQVHRASVTPTSAVPSGSRPPSGSASSSANPVDGATSATKPSTPNTTRRGSNAGVAVDEVANDEVAAMNAKKQQLERQLNNVNAASKLAKELIAGVAWVDVVDQNGTRMNLDSAGNTRVNTILTARQNYSAVSVTTTESGEIKVNSLVFKLDA